MSDKEKWHKAGWEDGVKHERQRSKGLVEALSKAMRFYISEGRDGQGWYQESQEALKKYEEMSGA